MAETLLGRIKDRIDELTQESKRAENEMEHLSAVSSKADKLSEKFKETKDGLSGVSGAFNDVNEKYDESINKHSTLASQLKMVQAEMEEMIRLAQESGDAGAVDATKSSKEYKDLADKAKSLKEVIASVKGKDAADGLTPLIRSISQVSAAFRTTKNPITAFRAGMTAVRGGMGLTKISIKGVISSLKALWASLLSNPITAIIALLAALAVGLVKVISSIKSQAEKQAELNAQEKAHLELIQAKVDANNLTYDQAIKKKERELAVLKAGNSSLEEQYKLEDEIYKMKKEKADQALDEWAEEAASVDELNELLLKQQTALQALEEVKNGRKRKEVNKDADYADAGIHVNRRSVEIDGVKITKGSVDDMYEAVQGMVDNTKKKLEIGIKVKEDVDDLTAEAAQTVKKREKDQKDRLATERSITRETAKMRISLINDCYAREVAMAKQANKERKEDLERRLKEEKNLTEEARKQINEQIKLSDKEMNRELARLAQERANRIIAIQRQIEDAQRSSAPRTSEEQRTDLRQTYDRKKEDITNQIRTGVATGSLSAKEIELLKKLRDEYENQYVKEIEILNQKLALESINVQKDAIALRLEGVREGSAEELSLRQQEIEKEREAALAANKVLAKDRQQSEADINAKFDKQQRDLLRSQLEQYLTYEQRRQKIAAEYADRRESLYQHDENGNRVKDADGNDVFISGAGQGNIDELNRQQSEAIQGLLLEFSEMLAVADQEYAVWLAHLDDVTTKGLRNMLATAKKRLATLTDPADIERYEAMIAELEEKLKNIHLSPEEEDYEQWKAEAEVISECASEVVSLGNSMGGATGKALALVGSVTKSIITTKSTIHDIHEAAEKAMKGIEDTSSATAKAIKAAEEASVILAIVGAIMEALKMVQEIVDGLSEWAEAQDIQWLQDILAVVQDIFAVITNPIGTLFSGLPSAAKKHKEKLEDIEDEIDELNKSYDTLERQAAKTFGSSNAEIRRQQIELKKAQIELLNTAIAEEKATKNPDDDAIEGWQNQIDQLNNEIEDLGEAAVDAIWGEDISSAITSFADAISNAWANNTSAAQASNDAIRDMIKKRIRQELLDEIQKEAKLQDIRDRIEEAFADGIITAEELAQIEALGEQTAAELEEKYGAIFRMLNADAETDRSASARGVATASQESIDETNGMLTTVTVHTFNISENSNIIRDNVAAILGSVQRIEYNTEELHTIRTAISDIQMQGVKIKS